VAAVVTPNRGGLTNRSGTITAGGTRQATAAVANPNRTYLELHNPGTADLYFALGANAAPSAGILLRPGGFRIYEGSYVYPGAVDVYGATTGQPFTVYEA
jgi:hypothetical protein